MRGDAGGRPPVRTEIVRTWAGLRGLEAEWAPLATAGASPLLDHDWYLTCAETLHAEADLRVVTVREGGVLVAVAPLVLQRDERAPRLALLGAQRLYEPGGWLWQTPEALRALVDAVRHVGWPMLLHRIDCDSPLPAALGATHPGGALVSRRRSAPSLAVDTRGSWEAYYASLSSAITGNLPRVQRRAERTLGPMRIDHLRPDATDVAGLLETFVAIEGSGWKHDGRSSLADRPDLRQFFAGYCHRAAARGQLRCARLSFGSTVAAMELSVEAHRRCWQLKIGYHAGVASYYPGLHLTGSSIRRAFAAELDSYEFLGVAEAWEERWRPVARAYETIVLYPWSVRGVIGVGRDLLDVAWRRARRQLAARQTGRSQSSPPDERTPEPHD